MFKQIWITLPIFFVYVIVTNHVNWHRENLQLDREKTGKTQGQYEWVPCISTQLVA